MGHIPANQILTAIQVEGFLKIFWNVSFWRERRGPKNSYYFSVDYDRNFRRIRI